MAEVVLPGWSRGTTVYTYWIYFVWDSRLYISLSHCSILDLLQAGYPWSLCDERLSGSNWELNSLMSPLITLIVHPSVTHRYKISSNVRPWIGGVPIASEFQSFGLIDWIEFYTVSAIFQPCKWQRLLVKCYQFWNFEVSLAALASLHFIEIQGNGLLHA